MASKHVEGLVYVACVIIGLGIGMIFGKTAEGAIIGVGVGLLAMAVFRMRAKKSESQK